MPTSINSGTQAATLNTEHTLFTDTGNHNAILCVDLGNMANGDVTELRLYAKTLSGGTERLVYVRRYQHAQAQPIVYSIPVAADISIRGTLKQTAGTGRSYDWSELAP